MRYLEILYGLLILLLGILSSVTDIRKGRIYNRMLVAFCICAVVLDAVCYGCIVREQCTTFVINVIILAIICLILFYTHAFAGGDCKLAIVMGLLYPANYYISYADNAITLYFTLGVAIFYGYLYLIATSIWRLMKGRNQMSREYVLGYLHSFAQSYLSAIAYTSVLSILALWLWDKGIDVNIWLIRAGCIGISWLVGKYALLQKWYIIAGVLFIDLILGWSIGTMPFSLNPENYILVLVLMLCQMTIRTDMYERVAVADLQQGMILSTYTTILMQNSRVRGLPELSTEDLSSRLTEDEVSAVKRWANSKKIITVSIVRKIPFAIFIFAGFISYFIAWSVIRSW